MEMKQDNNHGNNNKAKIFGLVGIIAFLGLLILIANFAFPKNKETTNPAQNNAVVTNTGAATPTESSVTPEVASTTNSGGTSLGALSDKVVAQDKEKEAEKEARVNNFSNFMNDYALKINADADLIPIISTESIDKISSLTKKRYEGFSAEEKELFLKDLTEIGWTGGFDPNNKADVEKYINFFVKGGFKTLGKISEVSDIAGVYDEKLQVFCGQAKFKYEENNTEKAIQVCLDKDNKMLIHN